MPNSPLPKAAERVELIVAGEIYQVAHTAKAEGVRIRVFSKGQLRLSLPAGTSDEQGRGGFCQDRMARTANGVLGLG